MANDSGYGQQQPEVAASDFARIQFQINQTLARVRTMVLVKVVAITGGAGAVSSPGTVNVQPLANMVDGQGNATPHGTIFAIPVFRLGGGTNAVICDPVVGDIGWMAVADRDNSGVIKAKGPANPGSNRKFDMADGVYMGSLLSAVPTQYITFTSTGIKMADANNNVLEMKSTGTVINGVTIDTSGNLATSGTIKSGAIDLAAHHHTAQGATATTTAAQP